MPDFAFVASIAVLNSLSHCVGMCGGFNTLLGVFLRQKSKGKRAVGYFLFHIGRIFSYALLGGLISIIGTAVIISQNGRAMLFFLVGCFMVFVAVALYFRGSILSVLENKSLAKMVSHASTSVAKSLNNPKKFNLKVLLLGALNGFLPCGVVYYFLSYAMLSQSWQKGVLTMILFGICTVPALLFTGVFAGFLSQYRQWLFNIAIALVGANGLYLAYLGYLAYG